MSSNKAEALASERIKKDSMLLETWRRVIKNPGALFGLILLGIITWFKTLDAKHKSRGAGAVELPPE